MRLPLTLLLVLALLATAGWPVPAAATPSNDACTGFLDPDPQAPQPQLHSINAPGTWCLRQDLVIQFSDVTYALIGVSADDVTVDCRGHKLQVVGGGQLDGIGASFSERLTVRNCRFEGFQDAVAVNFSSGGTKGHVVEDNVMVGNGVGVDMPYSTHVIVRRNRIEGGRMGVYTTGNATVTDNVIDGSSAGDYTSPITITNATGGEVRGNVIRNVHRAADATGMVAAVRIEEDNFQVNDAHVAIYDNVIQGDGNLSLLAALCERDGSRVSDNVIAGVGAVSQGCGVGTNDVSP
jgi:hypothetical protein